MSDEIDMEYTIGDVPPLRADEIYAAYDANRAEFVRPDTAHALHARLAELENLFHCAQAAKRRWRQTSNWWARRWQRDIDIDNRLQADIDDAHKQIDALESKLNFVRAERDARGLTLATLCDMVLRESATDRSDAALIRAVGTLKRERDAAQARSGARMAGVEYWKERAEQAEADARAMAQALDVWDADGQKSPEQVNLILAAALQKHGNKYLDTANGAGDTP